MPLYFHDVRTELSLQSRLSENVRIVMFIQNIVGDMLDDGRCLFVIDECSCFQDELFRVILELIEYWVSVVSATSLPIRSYLTLWLA